MLLERISVGGMAEVFKAKPLGGEGNGKVLAIKRILPSMAEDADFIQMFIDEAKISGQLNHGNIAQIYELGRVEDSHFIAMEFVWGKDLLQIQNRFRRIKQTMKPAMAAYIGARTAEGLDYAHKKADAMGKNLGIIHRDVSPQNVLCSYDGDVKVIDFGIAKAASRSTRTQAGVLKGKFGYMSPEQVRGLPLDRRSDIFAIATILYEMLTAERLFLGESDFATLEKVRAVDIQPPSKVVPNCPPELERIIMKGLAKDVEDRYQWGSEMAHDLNAFLEVHDKEFGTPHLSTWMKEQFAVEMKRESAGGEEAAAARPVSISMPMAAAASNPANSDNPASIQLDINDLDLDFNPEANGEATQITSGDAVAAVAALSGGKAPIAAQATQILDDVAHLKPAPTDLVGQSTMILDTSAPGAPQLPGGGKPELVGQATMILEAPILPPGVKGAHEDEGKPPLPGQSTVMLEAPVLPPMVGSKPAPGIRPAPAGGQLAANPSTSFVAPLAYQKKSSVGKDIFIGILVAGALVGGVLGGRALLAKDKPHGTMVITVNPPSPAAVLIDGAEKGRIPTGGNAVTLKDIPAGEHKISVKSDSGSVFEGRVTLVAGEVSVVNAALREVPRAGITGGIGKLKLNIKTKDAQVFVDGAQLDEDTYKDIVPLKASSSHDLKVTAAGHDDYRRELQLKADELVTVDVDLVSTSGHLTINSDPPGADVRLNSKSAGVTPLKLDDLDITKEARITVGKHGFVSVTRAVTFDKEREQTIDVKLVAGSGSTSVASSKTQGDDEFAAVKAPKGSKKEDKGSASKLVSDAIGTVEKKPPTKTAIASKSDPLVEAGDDGFLVAMTQPWARVIIDGKDTGKTTPIAPRSKIPLKPGKHVVTFVASGKSYNFDIVIRAGEDTRLSRQLTE